MKMMIWKELRENLKWAVLAGIVLALAEFYALSTTRGSSDNYSNVTLGNATFLMVTSFGCAVVGAAMGALQILPERRRDQWAALLHRPTSRSMIFFGKAAAGLLLYLIAAGLPYLAAIAYVATPGQFDSPLVPALVVPGLSDFVFGAAFYFLAILLCLHSGRWFGSRGAIAVAAVPFFMLHMTVGWPFLLPLGLILVLAVAAWGSMLGNGRPMGMARYAVVALVFTGSYAALTLAVSLLGFLPGTGPKDIRQIEYKTFMVTHDGEPIILVQKSDGSGFQVTDMNGNPLTGEKYSQGNYGNNFSQLIPLAWGSNLADEDAFSYVSQRGSASYIRPAERNYDAKEKWYYLSQYGYFIGYDKLSRLCLGTIDMAGFHPPGVRPAAPFPSVLHTSPWANNGTPLYWGKSQLYAFDFSDRSYKVFFDTGGPRIFGALGLSVDFEKRDLVAVATEDGINILSKEGALLTTFPYRYDVWVYGQLSATTNSASDRIYLQYSPSYWGLTREEYNKHANMYLDVLDLKGAVLNSYSQPAPAPEVSLSWFQRLTMQITPPAFVASGWAWQKIRPTPSMGPAAFTVSSPVGFNTEELPVILGLSMLLAALTRLWAARVGVPGAWKWTFFVFLFNLPGFVAFRLAADWPIRVRCPHGGHRRAIKSAECPVCRNVWPAPQRSGAEVFEAIS